MGTNITEYTSVTVVLAQTADSAVLQNKMVNSASVTGATATVVNGQQLVLVSVAKQGQVNDSNKPVAGKRYRIVGTGGLNLIGTYLGQPKSRNPQPMPFQIGD